MTKKEEGMSQLAQGETVIEGPATTGRALARRQPLPKELAALGVVAAVDQESGMQVLIIPKALREKFNVLAPVQAFQQADPNWRPSLRVVELDPSPDGPHFYKQAGGKLAPRKQALELLADAAGITEMRTQLLGRERVEVGNLMAETFTHLASGKIRKSDGTLRVLEASRTYEPFAEYEEIVTSVGSGQFAKKPGTPEFDAEVRKRWLNEIKFAKAKNESKAANRVIRAAIQSAHTYTPQRAALPYVIVGWNLSPQDTPEVRRAIAALYGGSPEADPIPVYDDWAAGEIAAAEDALYEEFHEDSSAGPDGADGGVREPADGSEPPRADDQGPEAVTDAPAPTPSESADPLAPMKTAAARGITLTAAEREAIEALTAEPMIPGLEPEPPVEAEGAVTDEERAQVTAFGKTKPPFGPFQTKTLAQIFNVGDGANEWLGYMLRRQREERDAEFYRLLELACRVHRPELYEAWKAEQA